MTTCIRCKQPAIGTLENVIWDGVSDTEEVYSWDLCEPCMLLSMKDYEGFMNGITEEAREEILRSRTVRPHESEKDEDLEDDGIDYEDDPEDES